MIYDCHNKTHTKVKVDFENWILMYQEVTPHRVITGKSDEMKKIIIDILEYYDFPYSIPLDNVGMINVM
jgi:hypothetical protein